MIYLQGANAFTPYRLGQILDRQKAVTSEIISLEVFCGYFVETHGELNQSQLTQLTTLLPDAMVTQLPEATQDFQCWVVPRVGTISPWSTKATDIAKICELEPVDRIERGYCYQIKGVPTEDQALVAAALHDPLTESVFYSNSDLDKLFLHHQPKPLVMIPFLEEGHKALMNANESLGLALSESDIEYLSNCYQKLKRDPTDVELMMFAQVNSEHCRHKIFNSEWNIDEVKKSQSLFDMIRNTYHQSPDKILSAYKDNAAVVEGQEVSRLFINPENQAYEYCLEDTPIVLKVETHNHPTAISPYAGAATGSGGEIRDEAATGRGAVSKAGLCGFSVSDLRIPNLIQPWETCIGKPSSIQSALDIMLEAPIGAASFNNEFGRPNICGYFRTCQVILVSKYGEICRGYHKPIMIAGGIGQIRAMDVAKETLYPQAPIIVLGGPAMAIGLGGGSASSQSNTENQQELDFASVQRSNPEMQRRAQEVINACTAMGENNPILSIHDVGAGGLSNAVPELVHDSGLGGTFQLRDIPNAQASMSPLEIWCNEAQERYVLSIRPESLVKFREIAQRERCPFAIIGEATSDKNLELKDSHFENNAVDLPMSVLFEDMPKMERVDVHTAPSDVIFDTSKIDLEDAVRRVLQFPCVASKSFLITIGDRSVGGLVARDQMVGPWQIPVADCGVTSSSFKGFSGEAIAMGERPPIALLHHAASARMAVGEAITNIAAALIDDISDLALSANWMAAADYPGEGAGLYDAVQTIAMELCPSLHIAIPVGKDSLSMRTIWEQSGQTKSVTAPLSLIITAAAKVTDVRRTLTPELQSKVGPTKLILIDLSKGANLLGASVLTQVYNTLGRRPPDVDDPRLLHHFFKAIQSMNRHNLLLAYHDRSDGGLLATLCEMMFAGKTGVSINLDEVGCDPVASLFAEELGGVIQVKSDDMDTALNILEGHGLEKCSHVIGELNEQDLLEISYEEEILYKNKRIELQKLWSETSYQMQALRDYKPCADMEFNQIQEKNDPGLNVKLNFEIKPFVDSRIEVSDRPKVAILREQGVNGHVEMAAAFLHAGFLPVDVHMSDLIAGRLDLSSFKGLAACGGFSYGDVLGAGRGWAQSILMHTDVCNTFRDFFTRPDTFTVGMCNGCQMLSNLRDIIPGSAHWPSFKPNQSEQFEARLSLVEIKESASIVFRGMAGSILPVVVSNAEGRAIFNACHDLEMAQKKNLIALQYVDNHHQITEQYPANPNGSPAGITALCSTDGRVTIMMPHPERIFRSSQLSWHPKDWGDDSPWAQMFYNARRWVG